jgi:hypothetical protein
MLLAVSRFGVDTVEVVRRLERAWGKHRAERGLDLYGRPMLGGTSKTTPSREHGSMAQRCPEHADDEPGEAE